MWHLGVFTKTSVGNITDEDIPAVNDGVITVSNNHFIPPVPMRILMVGAQAVNFGRVKIQTPKLRALVAPQLPRGGAVATPLTYSQLNDFTAMPISINAIDELSALVTTTAVAATQPTVGVWLDDMHTTHPRGEPYWIHGTSTVTGIANGWANAAITLDQTLPAGRYSVIGMRVAGTTVAMYARLIFPTQIFRPGIVTVGAVTANDGYFWENGYFGEFGQFASVAQPLLELFTSAAGAVTMDVFLQLLKL